MRDTNSVEAKRVAVPIASPSPLVGEGITGSRPRLGWVRGSVSDLALPKQPSPTRGEGKCSDGMRGLDPRIHPLRQRSVFDRWIAGSSPAMTSELP